MTSTPSRNSRKSRENSRISKIAKLDLELARKRLRSSGIAHWIRKNVFYNRGLSKDMLSCFLRPEMAISRIFPGPQFPPCRMAQTGPPAAYPDVLKGSKQVPSVRMAPDGVGFEIGSGTVQSRGATKKKKMRRVTFWFAFWNRLLGPSRDLSGGF